jgi:hypothetical protein
MKVLFYENGDIMTWGEEVPTGTELSAPADWHQFGVEKYVSNEDGTALVVRAGWVDPEPETPADPE